LRPLQPFCKSHNKPVLLHILYTINVYNLSIGVGN
jgi:hypothetical protein